MSQIFMMNAEQVTECNTNDLVGLFRGYLNDGIIPYIENCPQQPLVINIDEQLLPLVVNNGDKGAMYLSSPLVFYVDYNIDFVKTIAQKRLRYPLLALLKGVKWLLSCFGINKVVYLNNNLLPNNPALNLDKEQLQRVITLLTHEFPDHAVCVKGLQYGPSPDALQLLARQVYIWNPNVVEEVGKKAVKIRKTLKTDAKLLEQGKVTFEPIEHIDRQTAQKLRDFYRCVYVNKYSQLSADYSVKWFESLPSHSSGFKLLAVKKDGELSGFISYFETDEMIYSGLVGHDDHNGENGIYRACIRQLVFLAEEAAKPLHLSSGAGEFKRRRGARPHMEFDYILHGHLPLWRRMGWALLGKLFNSLGAKVMTNMKV
ncbi:hypothetical protein OE749_08975 [Aestuariibacter sp. AA17]|uniref:N-acetyltransferase domain-containing protein n=1 Tax=Fluctibacter corallii TaxID=2984329 RepID=A0ABT3A973_9ALTE|nr:hypothetical protein [Aestuariibacter sp. AA17]MCV2884827.1 hypothetical protein [Aestuariibacter sp. AA17]